MEFGSDGPEIESEDVVFGAEARLRGLVIEFLEETLDKLLLAISAPEKLLLVPLVFLLNQNLNVDFDFLLLLERAADLLLDYLRLQSLQPLTDLGPLVLSDVIAEIGETIFGN